MDQTLGHYKITSELGRGGMGVVYKAYEESLNRYVAIKVLGEHLGHDESFVKRFVREAKAAAALSHPNVIQIFFIGHEPAAAGAVGGAGGRHYFVMEFVEGRSVHELLKEEGALDPLRAARIVQQAASGLAAAHDHGLVHRDIKPANLLVTKEERVKIADFGLALAPSDAGTRLTATHSLMGTPGYLSPEQCCGEPAGPRSDIYSLGMTFYEMLTGAMPFKGESPLAVLRQILDEEPPKLLEVDPSLDPAIARVVERMVAKEPNDRYQSCHELLGDLAEIVGGPTSRASTGVPRPAVAGVVPPPPPPGPGAAPSRTRPSVAGARAAATAATPAPGAVAAVVAAASGGAPPAPPVGAGSAGASAVAPLAAAAIPPPPPAATSSGSGMRWLIIGAMVLMLVVAVSAGGLFLGRSWLKGAFEDITTADADEAPVASAAPQPRAQPVASAKRESEPAARVEAAPVDADSNPAAAASQSAPPGAEMRVAAAPSSQLASPRSLATSSGNAAAAVGGGSQPRSAIEVPAASRPAAPPAAPRRPALREKPRVAVMAIGEPTLASAAESALESALRRHGLDLYDERGILELRDAGGADGHAPSALVEIAGERGVDVLVLIDAETLGERELVPLNQRYDYATTSRLRVDAFLTAESDAIGRGWSNQVEYTRLNAETKADQAMGLVSNELAPEIGLVWRTYRASVAP
jgi:serine/threonine-protein kinase